MPKPESAENGVTFDLVAIDREMRIESVYESSGHMSRTLARTSDLRVMFVVMRGGSSIAEHHANETATIHLLSGHIRLKLPQRTVDLRTGQLLVLGSKLPHDVEALEDSSLVLTLGWSGDR